MSVARWGRLGLLMVAAMGSWTALLSTPVRVSVMPTAAILVNQAPLASAAASWSDVKAHDIVWPSVVARRQTIKHVATQLSDSFTNSKRMVWSGVGCEPNSLYRFSDDTARSVFQELVAESDLRDIHDDAGCFYFGRGVWSEALDVDAFQRDVAAVRTGKAKARWTCTMEQLSRQASLRMTFTESTPAAQKQKPSKYGGRPRKVRFGEVHHSECNLVNLKDPYSLLVALGSLRGGGTNYTSIEILGDSLHRGLFATIVAMLRGVGERAFFDRQGHTHLRYLVTAAGDMFTVGHTESTPRDTLLDIKFHSVFNYDLGSFPSKLRLHDQGPTVLIAGGLEHAEFDCKTREPRVAKFIDYASRLDSHVSGVLSSGMKLWRIVNDNTSIKAFPAPPDEALIVIKAGVQTHTHIPHNGGVLTGYFSMKNHMYREIKDKAASRVLKLQRNGRPPRAQIDYLHAAPSVVFLEEVRLYNLGDEGAARVDSFREGDANVTSILDAEVRPSDGLHSSCVMKGSLPAKVGGWRMQHSTCRGWRERGNVQLLASMIVATARQRYNAELQTFKWRQQGQS